MLVTARVMRIPVLLFFLHLAAVKAQTRVIPTSYVIPASVYSGNGSSATGHCLIPVSNSDGTTTCLVQGTSVLFDGYIPTLTRDINSMWASQLLTLQSEDRIDIPFVFSDTAGLVIRIEVAMINCTQQELWRIQVQEVNTTRIVNIISSNSSCDSFVQVYITLTTQESVLLLQFFPLNHSNRLYLAEITFYSDSSFTTLPVTTVTTAAPLPDTTITTPTPPPDTIITTLTPPLDTTITTSTPPPDTTITTPTLPTVSTPPLDTTDITSLSSATLVELPTHMEAKCRSCSTPTILASVLTAISTAVLATVIFVLVQITLGKCHSEATPGGAESAPSAGGEGLAEYEQVDVVALSDPTYMEVGAGGKGGGVQNTIELEENKAYGAFLASQN